MDLGKMIMAFTITMSLSIATLTTMINTSQDQAKAKLIEPSIDINTQRFLPPLPSKRLSRFLAENDVSPSPSRRAAIRCRRNRRVCTVRGGRNSACCNNRCVDLSNDRNNCGACRRKCRHTQSCCRGRCVYLAYDKRHCGQCNFRCDAGKYCMYGFCNYA